jgi:hypothetical protein
MQQFEPILLSLNMSRNPGPGTKQGDANILARKKGSLDIIEIKYTLTKLHVACTFDLTPPYISRKQAYIFHFHY